MTKKYRSHSESGKLDKTIAFQILKFSLATSWTKYHSKLCGFYDDSLFLFRNQHFSPQGEELDTFIKKNYSYLGACNLLGVHNNFTLVILFF